MSVILIIIIDTRHAPSIVEDELDVNVFRGVDNWCHVVTLGEIAANLDKLEFWVLCRDFVKRVVKQVVVKCNEDNIGVLLAKLLDDCFADARGSPGYKCPFRVVLLLQIDWHQRVKEY